MFPVKLIFVSLFVTPLVRLFPPRIYTKTNKKKIDEDLWQIY